MKIKISDATPLQLNWLAATLEIVGKKLAVGLGHYTDGSISIHILPTDPLLNGRKMVFAPAINWAQCGQILESHIFRLEDGDSIEEWPEKWVAEAGSAVQYGPTALIAIMRAYVASKMGEEVEVLEELCE